MLVAPSSRADRMDSTHEVRSFCSVTHSRWHAVLLGDGMAIWVVDDEVRDRFIWRLLLDWRMDWFAGVWEILY